MDSETGNTCSMHKVNTKYVGMIFKKPDCKISHVGHGRRWNDNIKVDHKERVKECGLGLNSSEFSSTKLSDTKYLDQLSFSRWNLLQNVPFL
jgi:hypothetical protein